MAHWGAVAFVIMAACEMVLGQPAHAINDGMMEHRATAAAAAYAPKPPRRECEKPPSPEAKAATCDQFLWIVDRKYSPIPQDKWPQAFAGGLMDPNSAWALQSMVNGDRLSGEQNCELKSMMTDLNAVGELAQKTGVRSPLIDSALAELAIKTMQSDDKMWEAKMRLLSLLELTDAPEARSGLYSKFCRRLARCGSSELGSWPRLWCTRVGRLEWRRRPGCVSTVAVPIGVAACGQESPQWKSPRPWRWPISISFPSSSEPHPSCSGVGNGSCDPQGNGALARLGCTRARRNLSWVQQLDPQIWQSVAATSDFQNAYRESIAKNFGAWFMKECGTSEIGMNNRPLLSEPKPTKRSDCAAGDHPRTRQNPQSAAHAHDSKM